MVKKTNISTAYKWAVSELKEAGIASYKIDPLLFLCHILNCDKVYIHTHPEYILTQDNMILFEDLIKKRSSHIPLQYLTGHCEFMSLKFFVNSHVLIPRQDTETLVEKILDEYMSKSLKNTISILDIGTGSGCISISLAKYLKNCHITAIDISIQALQTAQRNASLHNVLGKINFIESNLFSRLRESKFDIIVSNPPYIPTKDIQNLMKEVSLYEPLHALDGGIDGLSIYEKIIQASPDYLNQMGLLALEAGIHQAQELKRLMCEKFINIRIIKDLSYIDRVIFGNLKST